MKKKNEKDYFSLSGVVQGLRSEGSVLSLFILFREDVKSVETVEFRSKGLMLIDKGADDYPVSAQIIFEKGLTIAEVNRERANQLFGTVPDAERDPKIDFENLMVFLYFRCTEMLRFHEFEHQRRGNELIEEAIRAVKTLPREKVEFVEAA